MFRKTINVFSNITFRANFSFHNFIVVYKYIKIQEGLPKDKPFLKDM
jgi:hypothetical protein